MTIAGFMVDISNPEKYNYTGSSVIPEQFQHLPRASAAYFGGNTPHVWTAAQIAAQTNPYMVPIWVYDPTLAGASEGTKQGKAFLLALRLHSVPTSVRVVIDMETHVDPDFINAFNEVVEGARYLSVTYESESVGSRNPHGRGGIWSGSWDNTIHLDNGAWATQYANSAMTGHPFDISVVSSFTNVWDRRAPLPPPVTHSLMVKSSYSLDGGKTWSDFSKTPSILSF